MIMADERITLDNAAVLDVMAGKLVPKRRVVINGDRIRRVDELPRSRSGRFLSIVSELEEGGSSGR